MAIINKNSVLLGLELEDSTLDRTGLTNSIRLYPISNVDTLQIWYGCQINNNEHLILDDPKRDDILGNREQQCATVLEYVGYEFTKDTWVMNVTENNISQPLRDFSKVTRT
jgi:hypothetical protein